MATLSDIDLIRRCMDETRTNPNQCRQVGAVQISYVPEANHWIAVFDCDLCIIFDDVMYQSNNIILLIHGVKISWFCHMHQRLNNDI